MFLIILGGCTYILFFMLLPGLGAVTLRRRWERFREMVYSYSSVPRLEYYNLQPGEPFVFRGKLESFKNDNVVWLKGETLSISIDLKDQPVYTLTVRRGELVKSKWSSISSLIEGTTFHVFGTLEYERGFPALTGSKERDMLVVISDEEEDIFEKLLINGRVSNELWNSYTPYSYITGIFILIMLSYFSYMTDSNKTPSYFLLLAAGTPFYFIIPPGLLFYIHHRKLWNYSVRWSVLKDLKRLKGDYFTSDKMKIRSKSRERESLLFYLFGYILNITIAGVILFQLFQIIIYR